MSRGMCVARLIQDHGPSIEFWADQVSSVVAHNERTRDKVRLTPDPYDHIWRIKALPFPISEFVAHLPNDLVARYPFHLNRGDDLTVHLTGVDKTGPVGYLDTLKGPT